MTMMTETCMVEVCEYKVLARGYCSTHYKTKYWFKRKPLYVTWEGMTRRCRDKNFKKYPYYGGRGIKVCKRWSGKNGYKNFVFDMGEKPTPQHSIDRINVDGNYEPGNCRWATAIEQANNKRKQKIRYDSPLSEPGIRFRWNSFEARGTNGVHIGSYPTLEEAIIGRGKWYEAQQKG